jgi:hypothetical protein
MDFNFSCKIYHTKVYKAFTEVVALLTRKLAKLVSHFSDFSVNLYAFYKLQAKHSKLEESIYTPALRTFWTFTTIPSDLTIKSSSLMTLTGMPRWWRGAAAGDVGPGRATSGLGLRLGFPCSICGGGLAEDVAGERRRSRGNTAAVA